MARIEWIEHRLLNWARWKLAADRSPLGHARVNLLVPVVDGGPGYDESPIPTNAVEASELDAAINRLNPPGLARTLIAYYVAGGTVGDKARKLCCSVPTMYARIDQAHLQLARMLTERREAGQRERARVEALQAAVRPQGSSTG